MIDPEEIQPGERVRVRVNDRFGNQRHYTGVVLEVDQARHVWVTPERDDPSFGMRKRVISPLHLDRLDEPGAVEARTAGVAGRIEHRLNRPGIAAFLAALTPKQRLAIEDCQQRVSGVMERLSPEARLAFLDLLAETVQLNRAAK